MRPAIALLLCAAACGSPTEPLDHVHVRVNGSSFARGSDGFAHVTYTIANGGSSTVYVPACDAILRPVVIVAGVETTSNICLANLSIVPLEIAAHGTRSGDLLLGAAGDVRLAVLVDGGPARAARRR